MKILIAYYTKTGTTARCAAMLREKFFNHDMTVADLAATPVDFDAYDVLVLGAPIRMGHVDRRLRRLLRDHADRLAGKKLAFFTCCGLPHEAPEVMQQDIPAALWDSAVATATFGGELTVAAQHGIHNKLFVRLLRRSIKNKQLDDDIPWDEKPSIPEILPEHISRFADEIKRI